MRAELNRDMKILMPSQLGRVCEMAKFQVSLSAKGISGLWCARKPNLSFRGYAACNLLRIDGRGTAAAEGLFWWKGCWH